MLGEKFILDIPADTTVWDFVWTERNWTMPIIGSILLSIIGALFVKWRKQTGKKTIVQSTIGPQSPAIQDNRGDIKLTYGNLSPIINGDNNIVNYGISYDEYKKIEKEIEAEIKSRDKKEEKNSEQEIKISNQELDEFRRKLEENIKEQPLDKKLKNEIIVLLESKEYDRAEPLLMYLLKKDNKNASFNFLFASLMNLKLKYQEGLTYFEEAFRLQPEDSFYINAVGLQNLLLGNNKEAKKYFEKALQIDLSKHGDTHGDVSRDYANLGYALNALDEYNEAFKIHMKALEIDLKLYEKSHKNIATDYTNLGLDAMNLNEPKNAINYFTKALDIDIRNYGENHTYVATAYNNIASAWMALGDFDKARELFEKAVHVELKFQGGDNENVARNYRNLGESLRNLGRFDEAISDYNKALEIIEKIFIKPHPLTATINESLGIVWYQKSDFEKSIRFYLRAIEINRKFYDENHSVTGRNYYNIAQPYIALNQLRKALEFLEKALPICTRTLGSSNNIVILIQNQIYTIKKQLGIL